MEIQDQEKVWDSISKIWNEYRVKPVEEVVDFLKSRSGKVLDVGCGSGRNFIKKDYLEIYGVDFSAEQLKYAKEKYPEAEFKKMSDEKIDYEDEYFESVICARVLHCVESSEKRGKMISEIFRVLKNSGEAFFTTWSKDHKRLKNKAKEGVVSWKVDGKKFDRYTYIYELEELEIDLKSAGFKVLESFERDGNIFVRVVK